MKIAIISDIHGNMEALSSVLKDIQHYHINPIFCLGDCVGYGPEPHNVLDTIQKLNIPTVLGNHELAMLRPGYLSWFNPIARKSLEKTRGL
ncbi:MAG: metallophosphoesterase family protein, partial [Desulfobacteraceae bacterium]